MGTFLYCRSRWAAGFYAVEYVPGSLWHEGLGRQRLGHLDDYERIEGALCAPFGCPLATVCPSPLAFSSGFCAQRTDVQIQRSDAASQPFAREVPRRRSHARRGWGRNGGDLTRTRAARENCCAPYGRDDYPYPQSKRGAKPAESHSLSSKVRQLEAKVGRLEKELATAPTILEVQGKLPGCWDSASKTGRIADGGHLARVARWRRAGVPSAGGVQGNVLPSSEARSRAPRSADALAWLANGRFAGAVRGNHEQMMVNALSANQQGHFTLRLPLDAGGSRGPE